MSKENLRIMYKEDPVLTVREHKPSETEIRQFINEEAGEKNVIIGLSGGIDSSVVLALCAKIFYSSKIYGIVLPSATNEDKDYRLARELIDKYHIFHDIIEIEDIVQTFRDKSNYFNKRLQDANLRARVRMTLLRDIAQEFDGLVVGTTNKTENLLGYFTKSADGGSGVDFEPIATVYKTALKDMARYLEVPEEIIERAPTAGLWKGQTDEDELGNSYTNLDVVLIGNELGFNIWEIEKFTGIDKNEILRILTIKYNSEHKRHMPKTMEMKY